MLGDLYASSKSSPNSSSNTKTNTNYKSRPNSRCNTTSVPNYNNGTSTLYSTIIPGAYDLDDIAELTEEEIEGKVIIEQNKNTTKCRMETKQGAHSFDVEN